MAFVRLKMGGELRFWLSAGEDADGIADGIVMIVDVVDSNGNEQRVFLTDDEVDRIEKEIAKRKAVRGAT